MDSPRFRTKMVPTGLNPNFNPPSRVLRNPTHNWNVRHRPWQLQPVMIAPVLAGETLKNLLMQARVVSDPVKNPLIGMHLEYYMYYIPLRALSAKLQAADEEQVGTVTDRTAIENMLIDPTAPMVGSIYATAAAAAALYEYDMGAEGGNNVHWLRACTDYVAEYHFRDEGDNPAKVDDLPLVKLTGNSWLDSVYAADELPDNTVPVDVGGTDSFSLEEFSESYKAYLLANSLTMVELTFEDYLETFGERPRRKDPLAPELLMRARHWSYPSNTIGTSGDDLGVPSSALSWSVNERLDKQFRFHEPGFIVGFTVVRPKIYLKAQRTYAATMLADALAWMPAALKESVELSIKRVATGTGPLGGTGYRTTKDYFVDLRDLFVYGDQFVNFALTETDAAIIAGPHASDQANAGTKYPASTDLDLLFVNASPLNKIRQDGVVSLKIMGRAGPDMT